MSAASEGLVIEGLVAGYGEIQVLDRVALRVRPGEICALIGANGAGKTTTLNAISGVIRPRAGSIRWDGRELTGLPTHQIVEAGIVQVPEGRGILGGLTVEENLLLGGFRRRDRFALDAELKAMLERFPILGERRRALAGGLSGGEQQLLALARGLLARPRLLMLDEPSMGLAPQLARQVFEIISALRAEGRTILLVEQNARQALARADHAYVLQTGRILLNGTGGDLLHDPRVQSAYLGGAVKVNESRASACCGE